MKQLTVRGVDTHLHQHLQQEAKRRGQSLNRYVLSILQAAAGLADPESNGPAYYTDLDPLIGTWTEEEYAEFNRHLAAQRTIDEALWR